MLTIVLKVLSILGILLLILSLLAVTLLLLVLFVPITYRISGAKDTEGFRISAKVKWLLGLARLRYGYPEPGELAAKFLFFTLYRAKIPPEEKEPGSKKTGGPGAVPGKTGAGMGAGSTGKEKKPPDEKGSNQGEPSRKGKRPKEESALGEERRPGEEGAPGGKHPGEGSAPGEERRPGEEGAPGENKHSGKGQRPGEGDVPAGENPAPGEPSGIGKFLQKFGKIKYTIHSIYDKIKEIRDNISYYLELLQEEETKLLFSHIRVRAGKIIKSMRPRHIKAEIIFGAGSPDTTGYLYGAYCMFSPVLGDGVCVTPNFEEALLRAEFTISGHISLWVLAVNAGRIALDKRLRRLISKMAGPGRRTGQKKAA